jgi:CubicO group peptidase (beta-lactamase class C family)
VNDADLAALLRDHAARHRIPGAAVGLLRDGQVMTAYAGVADVTTAEPITSETLFSVGSLTKSMVATVIAGLAGEGRLSLDDPVATHVPELRGGSWAERASVRDLLANRSGLPLRKELEFGFGGHPDGDDAALSRLVAGIDPRAPAAEVWSYTNVGWCVLGRVIESTTGAPWETAMDRHLFAPAGMGGTTFATEPGSRSQVSGHEITATGAVPVGPLVSRAYGPAGTSVLGTVTDLLRFAALHLEDASLASLRVEHDEIAIHGWLEGWGLGWGHFAWSGADVWGWDGLINGERSVLRLAPEQRAAIVLMTNGSTGRGMYRSFFADLVESWLGISFPSLRLVPMPGIAGDLARFAGTYAWPDRAIEITATPGGLVLLGDDRQVALLPLDGRAFLINATDPDNPTVTFGAFDADGRPGVLYSMLWGLPRVTR